MRPEKRGLAQQGLGSQAYCSALRRSAASSSVSRFDATPDSFGAPVRFAGALALARVLESVERRVPESSYNDEVVGRAARELLAPGVAWGHARRGSVAEAMATPSRLPRARRECAVCRIRRKHCCQYLRNGGRNLDNGSAGPE